MPPALKKRIKSGVCPNCSTPLDETFNFCPDCGQENDDKRQSFGKLMAELVEGFTSIDSQLVKSVPALLFKPGFLTREYLAGKRKKYLHPVRMFITLVVVYFIFASGGVRTGLKVKPGAADSISVTEIPANIITSLDSLDAYIPIDSLKPDGKKTVREQISVGGRSINFDDIRILTKKGVTQTHAVLDSLQIKKTLWNRILYHELIRIATTDFDDFKDYLISKIPWIIFGLMPVFALLLKLLFVRHRFLYIDHLIFAFHLHSFIFLSGIIYLLIEFITPWQPENMLTLVIFIYTLFAFRNFYRQSWAKTLLKMFALALLYCITALISTLLMMLILFLIY